LAVSVCLLLLFSTIFSFTTQGQLTYAASNNKPPVVVASERIPKQTIALGQTKVIDLSKLFYDADGDTLTYAVVTTPVGIVTTKVNGNQLTIEGLAPGNTRIKVTADDGKLGRAMSSFEVEGLLYTNSSPEVAQGLTNQTLVVNSPDSTFDISNVFTDADNDVLTFSAVSDNTAIATVSLNDTTLSVSPIDVGTATITLTASDGNGGTISTTFTVTVTAASANHAPIVAKTIKNQRGIKNGLNWNVELQDVFTDEDQDVLTFSASSSNGAVASATSNGGTTLSLTPKEVGTSTITVTADDGNGGQASTSFTVTVDAPMIFISDFVQGGDGRDVIQLRNPNMPYPIPAGYEIVIHQYDPTKHTHTIENVEVFNIYVKNYVAINSVFYDYMDITGNQYYNSEYFITSGNYVVAIALELNGQIVDLIGDPSSTTALLPNNGGFSRLDRFQSGSSEYNSSEWRTLETGNYSTIDAKF